MKYNIEDYNYLIGRTLDDAEEFYGNLRVVKQDGKERCVTCDYWPNRLNVAIEKSIVTEIISFG